MASRRRNIMGLSPQHTLSMVGMSSIVIAGWRRTTVGPRRRQSVWMRKTGQEFTGPQDRSWH